MCRPDFVNLSAKLTNDDMKEKPSQARHSRALYRTRIIQPTALLFHESIPAFTVSGKLNGYTGSMGIMCTINMYLVT